MLGDREKAQRENFNDNEKGINDMNMIYIYYTNNYTLKAKMSIGNFFPHTMDVKVSNFENAPNRCNIQFILPRCFFFFFH